MFDFINSVKNILEDKGKTTDCLFKENIISKHTFYKYKHRNPSLQTLIKIANYLEVTVDYLYELTDENNFSPYSTNQSEFYKTLLEMIEKTNLSARQFCKQMNFSKDNILRYKKGVEPSVSTLFEISKFFKCSVDDLLQKD